MAGPLSIRKVLGSSIVLLASQCVIAQGGVQEAFLENGDGADADDGAGCHNACTALLNELPEITHYGPTSELQGFSEGYFSAFQREVVPACVITPTSSHQVSQTLTLLHRQPQSCPLAIKSGGHAPSVGLSNVAGGITIDLKLLNEITYLGEKDWDGTPFEKREGETTRVGPGNRWHAVYEKLQPYGRTVVGGRAASVGVGGFILGGGISFLSHTHGWSADTVRNFEIVLPNGTLTNVNHDSNPSLFSALRGSGSNFGIVTAFDMETYPQSLLWGGYRFYFPPPWEINSRKKAMKMHIPSPLVFYRLSNFMHLKNILLGGVFRVSCLIGYCAKIGDYLQAFEDAVLSMEQDLGSHLFMSFSYAKAIDQFIMAGQLVNSQGVVEPEAFKGFKGLKHVYSQSGLKNVTDLTMEVDQWNPAGHRQEWRVQTILTNSATLSISAFLDKATNIFIEEVDPIKHIRTVVPSITFQPISRNELIKMRKNDGNALGLEDVEGPLVIFSHTISYDSEAWSLTADDIAVKKASDNIYNRCKEIAKEAGIHHPFQYLNYASGGDDVFAGYGERSREWLRGVKRGVLGLDGKGMGKGRWDVGGFRI